MGYYTINDLSALFKQAITKMVEDLERAGTPTIEAGNICEQILINTKTQMTESKSKIEDYCIIVDTYLKGKYTLASLINALFIWDKTPQGGNYWNSLTLLLYEKK